MASLSSGQFLTRRRSISDRLHNYISMLEYLFKVPWVKGVAEIRAKSLEQATRIMERITAQNSPKGFEFVGTQEVQMFNLPDHTFGRVQDNTQLQAKKMYNENKKKS